MRTIDATRADCDESRANFLLALEDSCRVLGWRAYVDGREEEGGNFCTATAESRDIIYVKPGTGRMLYTRLGAQRNGPLIWRVPGLTEQCAKCKLALSLNRLSALWPSANHQFEFMPKTFCMPRDEATLLSVSPSGSCFIIKPDDGKKGEEIRLCHGADAAVKLWNAFAQAKAAEASENSAAEVNQPPAMTKPKQKTKGKPKCVIQSYISDPMLIDGRKFDIRLYVLVTAVLPQAQIFVFEEGLIRMCAEKYEAPSIENFDRRKMHLSNVAVNGDGGEQGAVDTKRKLSELLNSECGPVVDKQNFWSEVDVIVSTVIAAMQPELGLQYNACFGSTSNSDGPSSSKCFQILGFDVMLDSRGKAWLLEVNAHPSFATPTRRDREIKVNALGEALRLVEMHCLLPRERGEAAEGEGKGEGKDEGKGKGKGKGKGEGGEAASAGSAAARVAGLPAQGWEHIFHAVPALGTGAAETTETTDAVAGRTAATVAMGGAQAHLTHFQAAQAARLLDRVRGCYVRLALASARRKGPHSSSARSQKQGRPSGRGSASLHTSTSIGCVGQALLRGVLGEVAGMDDARIARAFAGMEVAGGASAAASSSSRLVNRPSSKKPSHKLGFDWFFNGISLMFSDSASDPGVVVAVLDAIDVALL